MQRLFNKTCSFFFLQFFISCFLIFPLSAFLADLMKRLDSIFLAFWNDITFISHYQVLFCISQCCLWRFRDGVMLSRPLVIKQIFLLDRPTEYWFTDFIPSFLCLSQISNYQSFFQIKTSGE